MRLRNCDHPLVVDRLWLVAERVGHFLDIQGLQFDPGTGVVACNGYPAGELGQADELFAAGARCLSAVLAERPHVKNCYLRTAIDNAIRAANQTDRLLAVPPSTRRDRIKRGDEPGDWQRQAWDHVFDDDVLLPSAEPHWRHAESQWTAPLSSFAEWAGVVETYQALFSFCRDDTDRQIIQLRCDGLSPAVVAADFLPVHVADVARTLGLSDRTVQRRLDDLERRYYHWAGHRRPTKRQRQRAPR